MHHVLLVLCCWPAAGGANMLLFLLHLFTDVLVTTEPLQLHIFGGKKFPGYDILPDGWNNSNRYAGEIF